MKDVLDKVIELERELKNTNTAINQCNKLISDRKSVLARLQKQANDISNRLQVLRAKRAKGIKITDHAVLRFLERELGVDVDSARLKLKEEASTLLNQGDGLYPILSGKVAVKNNNVVTFMKEVKS